MPPNKRRSDPSAEAAEGGSLGAQHLRALRPAELAAQDEQRFEAAVVERILTCYGRAAAMREEIYRRTQGSAARLTFDAFWAAFPGYFPLYLFVRRFRRLPAELPLHRLLDRFVTCRPVRALLQAQDQAPAPDPGLVFFWPHLQDRRSQTRMGGALVLHRYGLGEFDDVAGAELRYRQGDTLWRLAPLGFFLEGCQRAGVLRTD